MIEYHRRVIAFLESAGATNVRLRPAKGHGHPVIVFRYRGQDFTHHVALSPGYRAAAASKISEVRRRLRQIDAESQPKV